MPRNLCGPHQTLLTLTCGVLAVDSEPVDATLVAVQLGSRSDLGPRSFDPGYFCSWKLPLKSR